MSQPPRKAKELFRGQLTQFKFEELTDVKEIGMYTSSCFISAWSRKFGLFLCLSLVVKNNLFVELLV